MKCEGSSALDFATLEAGVSAIPRTTKGGIACVTHS